MDQLTLIIFIQHLNKINFLNILYLIVSMIQHLIFV